jgi:hypothetical protein
MRVQAVSGILNRRFMYSACRRGNVLDRHAMLVEGQLRWVVSSAAGNSPLDGLALSRIIDIHATDGTTRRLIRQARDEQRPLPPLQPRHVGGHLERESLDFLVCLVADAAEFGDPLAAGVGHEAEATMNDDAADAFRFAWTGTPVVIDPWLPVGTCVQWGNTLRFQSRALLDSYIRRVNHLYRLRLPTRAMRGNARRRALMAQVRARTYGPYWIDEMSRFSDQEVSTAIADGLRLKALLVVE